MATGPGSNGFDRILPNACRDWRGDGHDPCRISAGLGDAERDSYCAQPDPCHIFTGLSHAEGNGYTAQPGPYSIAAGHEGR